MSWSFCSRLDCVGMGGGLVAGGNRHDHAALGEDVVSGSARFGFGGEAPGLAVGVNFVSHGRLLLC